MVTFFPIFIFIHYNFEVDLKCGHYHLLIMPISSKIFQLLSDTTTKEKELKESVAEEHDITSPVRSFLEKSKQQVEKYWKSMVNDVDEEEETKQRELEAVFLRTVFNEQEGDDDDDEDDSTVLKAGAAFSKLEDFLNPDNVAIKKLVEHRVLKNPTVLSELLDVKFSDLLKAFQNIMAVKVSSTEAAYLHLLQIVEDEGAAGIARLAASTTDINDEDNDELVHAFASGAEGNQFEYKMTNDDTLRQRANKMLDDQNLPLTDLTAKSIHQAFKQMSSDSNPVESSEEPLQTFETSNGKDEL